MKVHFYKSYHVFTTKAVFTLTYICVQDDASASVRPAGARNMGYVPAMCPSRL